MERARVIENVTPQEEALMIEAFDSHPTMYSYCKGALLDNGSSCKVYRAKRVDSAIFSASSVQVAPQLVALKEFSLLGTKRYQRGKFMKEVNMMKKMDHENCIRFHKAIWELGDATACIVMELADCGDLTGLISRVTLREDHMAAFCREVSSGSKSRLRGRLHCYGQGN